MAESRLKVCFTTPTMHTVYGSLCLLTLCTAQVLLSPAAVAEVSPVVLNNDSSASMVQHKQQNLTAVHLERPEVQKEQSLPETQATKSSTTAHKCEVTNEPLLETESSQAVTVYDHDDHSHVRLNRNRFANLPDSYLAEVEADLSALLKEHPELRDNNNTTLNVDQYQLEKLLNQDYSYRHTSFARKYPQYHPQDEQHMQNAVSDAPLTSAKTGSGLSTDAPAVTGRADATASAQSDSAKTVAPVERHNGSLSQTDIDAAIPQPPPAPTPTAVPKSHVLKEIGLVPAGVKEELTLTSNAANTIHAQLHRNAAECNCEGIEGITTAELTHDQSALTADTSTANTRDGHNEQRVISIIDPTDDVSDCQHNNPRKTVKTEYFTYVTACCWHESMPIISNEQELYALFNNTCINTSVEINILKNTHYNLPYLAWRITKALYDGPHRSNYTNIRSGSWQNSYVISYETLGEPTLHYLSAHGSDIALIMIRGDIDAGKDFVNTFKRHDSKLLPILPLSLESNIPDIHQLNRFNTPSCAPSNGINYLSCKRKITNLPTN